MKFLAFYLKITLFHQIKLGSNLGILALISYYPLHIKPFQSFDEGFEVRSVFLDISKALDKGWHKGLIFKLRQNGISGNLLDILSDFLSDRKQRVVLNGKKST